MDRMKALETRQKFSALVVRESSSDQPAFTVLFYLFGPIKRTLI
jgi:hypothetical protein